MRIEDVGSLSPAGDLLAFSLALVITFGLINTLSPDIDHENPDFPFEEVFRSLLDWTYIDTDEDGLIEPPSHPPWGENPIFPRKDVSFLLSMRSAGLNYSMLFIHGSFNVLDCRFDIVSVTHSIPALFELNLTVQTGSLSICEVEKLQ